MRFRHTTRLSNSTSMLRNLVSVAALLSDGMMVPSVDNHAGREALEQAVRHRRRVVPPPTPPHRPSPPSSPSNVVNLSS